MTARFSQNEQMRRPVLSPRSRGRDHKDTPCRNVLIHGHCRFQDHGCTFNHGPAKNPSGQQDSVVRRPLNIDSPSFTPSKMPAAQLQKQQHQLSHHSHPQHHQQPPHIPHQPRQPPIQPHQHHLASQMQHNFHPQHPKHFQPHHPHSHSHPQQQQQPAPPPPPPPAPQQPQLQQQPQPQSQQQHPHPIPHQPAKKSTFTSHAATAAPFTPRQPVKLNPESQPFNVSNFKVFTPPGFDPTSPDQLNGAAQDGARFDPLSNMAMMGQALPPAPFNPYTTNEMMGPIAGPSGAYMPPQPSYTPALNPPQYHLYAPIGPYREDLLPYQRANHEFFMPERIREEMQRRSHATLQVLPPTAVTLPQVDHYHSLFPLDTSSRKNTTIFGYTSWVYKAMSSRTGRFYALRRLHGYRLTNENAIRAINPWKNVVNANVVILHEAFTTRNFGDPALIVSYDYHPRAKTLAEHHFPSVLGVRYRSGPAMIPENTLWSYICQITNALKAIHSLKLAARCMDMSKILLTSTNRIRLAGCGILDVVNYESDKRPLPELQKEDLANFGKLMLCLATTTQHQHLTNPQASLESLGAKYSTGLKQAIAWLVSPFQPGEAPKTIDTFIGGISYPMITNMDRALHEADSLSSLLQGTLESDRLFRLMAKLGTINERGEYANDAAWSEHGDRYPLKLFRDYVFHQVNVDGKPRVDLNHIIQCLNKLDAGSDERIVLTSRDGQTTFYPSYRELKGMCERSFNELITHSKR